MKEKLAKLSPLKIGSWGQIQEWKQDLDDPNNTHRHISQLVGLYPGNHISSDTPELLEAAKVTLTHRGDAGTGWSRANKINLWARALDGDHAYRIFQGQLTGSTHKNLFDTHPPFQIDGNFGATSGIAEMLLQSQSDTIDPLAALPTAWSKGSVKGLKARGNFEVDMNWENMKANTIRVKSDSGNVCKLKYPLIGTARVETLGGVVVAAAKVNDNVLEFQTVPGETYIISGIPYQQPETPQNLKARRTSEDTANLTWDASKYAASYSVYRKSDGEFEKIASGILDTQYIDTNAVNLSGNTYYYCIMAVNESGESQKSLEQKEEAFEFLSDIAWVSATTGWGSIQKDRSCDGNSIRLKGESGTIEYEKGIGTHANSEILYNLDGKDFSVFESDVGVDQEMASTVASVIFQVWADGLKMFDSGLMNAGTQLKHISLDVSETKQLKLIVTDGGNGNGSDHGDWAGALLRTTIKSNNSQLSGINLDGTLVKGFNAAKLVYDVELPYGSVNVPVVTAAAIDSKATVEITKAIALPGSTAIKVTAEDGSTTSLYTMNFTVTPNSEDPSECTAVLEGPTTVYPSTEFNMTFGLSKAEAVLAQDITINFNSENIEYLGAESILSGANIAATDTRTPGLVRIILASEGTSKLISGDKTILKLKFKTKKSFERDTIAITGIKLADSKGIESDLDPVSKVIRLSTGDVNGDGKFSVGDLGIIAKCYGISSSDTEWEYAAKADINGDNKIGLDDLVMIAKRILSTPL